MTTSFVITIIRGWKGRQHKVGGKGTRARRENQTNSCIHTDLQDRSFWGLGKPIHIHTMHWQWTWMNWESIYLSSFISFSEKAKLNQDEKKKRKQNGQNAEDITAEKEWNLFLVYKHILAIWFSEIPFEAHVMTVKMWIWKNLEPTLTHAPK